MWILNYIYCNHLKCWYRNVWANAIDCSQAACYGPALSEGIGYSNIFIANIQNTVKILKFGTPQTIAIIVLEIEKFDVTLH